MRFAVVESAGVECGAVRPADGRSDAVRSADEKPTGIRSGGLGVAGTGDMAVSAAVESSWPSSEDLVGRARGMVVPKRGILEETDEMSSDELIRTSV